MVQAQRINNDRDKVWEMSEQRLGMVRSALVSEVVTTDEYKGSIPLLVTNLK